MNFFEDLKIGKIFQEKIFFESWRVKKNLESSGDKNSIHRGLKAVVPGALILGRISAMISDIFADGSMMVGIDVTFKRPIYTNTFCICIIEVDKKKAREKNGLVKINVSLLNEFGRKAIKGTGSVCVPVACTKIQRVVKVFACNYIT